MIAGRFGGASRTLARALLVACLLAASTARATPAEDHFRVGLQLYQARNFTGALAEFEETYRLQASPAALQNVALCQRALFRYAESIATLERMLRDHAATVDPEDARAAAAAIAEMSQLVATVRLHIEPPDSTVTVDDRTIDGAAERVVRLNVGEHHVVVTAPRHVRYDQSLSFAGGERELSVRLEAVMATVSLEADDITAAIEIDGSFRAFGSWTGELSADQPHTVRLHQDGHAITTTELTLERGERRTVHLPASTRDDRVRSPYSTATPPGVALVQHHGPYGLLTATNYTMLSHPDGFRPLPDNNGSDTFFGLRGGYRFTNLFGIEGLVETGKHSIGPGCYVKGDAPASCTTDPGSYDPTHAASYELRTTRVGGQARFMTPGERFRFLATAGVGLVYHRLSLTKNPELEAPVTVSGKTYQAYVLLEAGVELTFGGALVSGMLAVAFDGANSLNLGNGERAYSGQRNIGMAGIGLRLGYGHW